MTLKEKYVEVLRKTNGLIEISDGYAMELTEQLLALLWTEVSGSFTQEMYDDIERERDEWKMCNPKFVDEGVGTHERST